MATLYLAGLETSSMVKVAEEAAGTGGFRSLDSVRTSFPTADGAIHQLLLPLATHTYVYNSFPAMALDGAPVETLLGEPAAFEGLYLLHIRIGAYDDRLPATGTVAVTLTDMFGSGAADYGTLQAGDEIIRTKKKGFALISTSALQLVVTDPVNLNIEILFLGPETTSGIYTSA